MTTRATKVKGECVSLSPERPGFWGFWGFWGVFLGNERIPQLGGSEDLHAVVNTWFSLPVLPYAPTRYEAYNYSRKNIYTLEGTHSVKGANSIINIVE